MQGFGQFGLGVQRGLDKGRERRAEVAELFEAYRQNNPQATADELWQFAESIAGGANMYLRGSLPTREGMARIAQESQRQKKMEEARERLNQASTTLDMQDKFRRQMRERMIWEDDPERAMGDVLQGLGYQDDPEFRSQAYGWIGDPRAFQENARSEYRMAQRGKYLDMIGSYKDNRMAVPDSEWEKVYAGQPQWVIDEAKRQYEIDLSARAADDQRKLNEARSGLVGNAAYIKILATDPGSPEAKSIENQIRREIERYTPAEDVDAATASVMAELQERADTYKLQKAMEEQEGAAGKLQERYLTQAKSNAGRAKDYSRFGVSALGISDPEEAETIAGATEVLLNSLFSDHIALPSSTSDMQETDIPYHVSQLAAQAVRDSAQANDGMPNLADARTRLMANLGNSKDIEFTTHRNAARLAQERARTLAPKPKYAEEFVADKVHDVETLISAHDEALDQIDSGLQGAQGSVLVNNLKRKQSAVRGMIRRLEREIADIQHIRKSPSARAGGGWTETTGDRAIAAAQERINQLNEEIARTEEKIANTPQDTSGYGAYDVRRGRPQSTPQSAPTTRHGRRQSPATSGRGDSIDQTIASLVGTEADPQDYWRSQNAVMGSGGKGHFGRLQFSRGRLKEASEALGVVDITPELFMANPRLQQSVERWHFQDIDNFIRDNGLDRYIGRTIKGVPLDIHSLRAIAHLGGKKGLKRFLESGGKYNPQDDNKTSLLDYANAHRNYGRG